MAKGIKKCKVCGKEYEYCKTWLSTDKFRWQDVACSPECGAKYFALIEASRSANEQAHVEEPDASEAKKTVKKRAARKKSVESDPVA